MEKKILLLPAVALFAACGLFAQNNLVVDGSFEKLDAGGQLPRIAAFNDYGGATQTANPASEALPVEQGKWYRKASNTAYLKAVVSDEDAQDGNNAIKLAIGRNSSQAKLDNWYSNSLVQFLPLADKTEYLIKFQAKSPGNAGKLYVGFLNDGYSPMQGSKWVNISPEWAEYTVKIKTKSKAAQSAVVIGMAAVYDASDKTESTIALIDNVEVVANTQP